MLTPNLEKPKGNSGGSGSGAVALKPEGGLFLGGVPHLRPAGAKDLSENLAGELALKSPVHKLLPKGHRCLQANGCAQDDTDRSRASLPELSGRQGPSLLDLSQLTTTSSTGRKHSSWAPLAPPLPMHLNKAPVLGQRETHVAHTRTQAAPWSRGTSCSNPVKTTSVPCEYQNGTTWPVSGFSSPISLPASWGPQWTLQSHQGRGGSLSCHRGHLGPLPRYRVIGYLPQSRTLAVREYHAHPLTHDPKWFQRCSAFPTAMPNAWVRTPEPRQAPTTPPTRTPAGPAPPPPSPPPLRNGHSDSIATVILSWMILIQSILPI